MPVIGSLVTEKELARTQCITCSSCGAKQSYLISRRRTWLTLFAIPCFLLSTRYAYSCPGCKNSHPLVKQQVKYMIKRALPAGK